MSKNKDIKDIKASKILIIDDDAVMRIMLRQVFEYNGFNNISEACNGQEGWEQTLKLFPDMVLLDINMPVMDGFEFCKMARAHEAFDKMVILVQTGMTDPEEKQEIFKSGATDYVSKPVDRNEILSRSLVHLKNTYYLKELEDFNSRVKMELESAKRLVDISLPNESLLQDIKNNHGIKIFSYFQSSSEMGGDFWGAHPIDEKRIGIYIVDFSGHGVNAALNATRLDCLIKSSSEKSADPARLLHWLNNNLYALLPSEQYATMFYGVIDIENDTITYAAAASPEMLIMSGSRPVQILSGEGYPLGVIREATYSNETAKFMPGEMLMLYSDALIETPDVNGHFLQNISEKFLKNYKVDQPESVRECFDAFIYNFMSNYGDYISDDLTVTLYKRAVRNK